MTHSASSREHANRIKRLKTQVFLSLNGSACSRPGYPTASDCRKTASFAVDSSNWRNKKWFAGYLAEKCLRDGAMERPLRLAFEPVGDASMAHFHLKPVGQLIDRFGGTEKQITTGIEDIRHPFNDILFQLV